MKPFLLSAALAALVCTNAGAQQVPQLIKDLSLNNQGNYLREAADFNGKLVALTGVIGPSIYNEIVATDGTANGTYQVTSTISSDRHMNPVVFNNKVYFVTQTYTSGYHNLLAYTDGINFNGTSEVNPQGDNLDMFAFFDYNDQINNKQLLTIMGNKLYFFATETRGSDYELFSSDGTRSGTTRVKDINLHGNDGAVEPSQRFVFALETVNNSVFFTANDYGHGAELWMTDGTSSGTVMVKDINTTQYEGSNPSNFIAFNNKLFFSATETGVASDTSFWVSDGTSSGTVKLASGLFNYRDYAVLNNKLYFYAEELPGNTGGLWVTDGTPAGTKKVVPASRGNYMFDMSKPIHLTAVNGKLVYSSDNITAGNELFVSDGVASGYMLKDLNGTTSGSYPSGFVEANGRVYFKATTGIMTPGEHIDVWSTDGTVAGTVRHDKPGTNVALQMNEDYFLLESPILKLGNDVIFSNYYDVRSGNGLPPYYKINTMGVGVPEIAKNEIAVSVYPNPATRQITVAAENMQRVEIYNVFGAQMLVKEVDRASKAEMDVATLAAGYYAVKLSTTDGRQYMTNFIKQ